MNLLDCLKDVGTGPSDPVCGLSRFGFLSSSFLLELPRTAPVPILTWISSLPERNGTRTTVGGDGSGGMVEKTVSFPSLVRRGECSKSSLWHSGGCRPGAERNSIETKSFGMTLRRIGYWHGISSFHPDFWSTYRDACSPRLSSED